MTRSSAEREYCAMALANCELFWLKQFLRDLQFGDVTQITLICDNQVALHINSTCVFHERTKHIEIDCLIEDCIWRHQNSVRQFK